MCVIIVKPSACRIPTQHLHLANSHNPHGWGVAARTKSGRIIVQRGFTSKALVEAYRKYAGLDMVVHCRIGTSGPNDLANTHPFEVADGIWMFHNGIFKDIPLTTPDRSDTWHLAEILKPEFESNPLLLRDPNFEAETTAYCRKGYPNKLVFFGPKDLLICNEKAGIWHKGMWYSNYSAFPYNVLETTPRNSTAPRPKYWANDAKPRKVLTKQEDLLPFGEEEDALSQARLARRQELMQIQIRDQANFERYVQNKYRR